MKRQGIQWILGALTVLLVAGCAPEPEEVGTGSSSGLEGKTAPDINLPLTKGAPAVALSSLKGKVVIVDFWATWCGPCKQSIPQIEQLYKKYHEKGLEVVGISVDDPQTAINVPTTAQALGITYPIVLFTDVPGIQSKYSFGGIPQLYLIDKQGVIRKSESGYNPSNNLDARIEALIDEKS